MSEREGWHSLLGIPEGVQRPDLYQVLGIERRRFDASLIDRAFQERLRAVRARGGTLVPKVERELVKARRVLSNEDRRAEYDRRLDLGRRDKLRRLLETLRARGPLGPGTEQALLASAVAIGMSEGEAREAIRAELARPETRFEGPSSELRTARVSATQLPTKTDMRTRASPSRTEPAAARPSAALSRFIGRTIADRYEVVAALGEGGMGMVFKARHKLLDRFVALKIVNPELADRPNVRERFLREAKAALDFVHPNAVPVRDFGTTEDGLLYMTQDFSPGGSLRALLDAEGRLPLARAVSIARQCLLALGEAHRAKIVHRDVKPENILVETRGEEEVARLCDFGIAKIAETQGEGPGSLTGVSVVGTPHYMSPEQGAGDKVDGRADLYSMGCVLHEMLTGKKVFDGPTSVQVIMMHVTQPPTPPSQVCRDLPPTVDVVLANALSKTPEGRFQTADAFVSALDALGTKRDRREKRRSRVSPVAVIPEEPPAPVSVAPAPAATTKTGTDFGIKFCGRCGVSLPDKWQERGEARRVGARLVCRACCKPVDKGEVCMGCFRPLAGVSGVVEAGGGKRICPPCASKAEILRVCAGCQVLLPRIAFERGEAVDRGGKCWCRECLRARR